jgi:Lon protease-like protein
VVLFPKALLALHVFEPRYRLMMDEVIQRGQSICMALLKPGWEANYYGSPEVHAVGCVGKVVGHQLLVDGRYNITLQGEYKVTIQEFERDHPFRIARMSRLDEDEGWCGRGSTPGESRELLAMFRRFHEGKGAALDVAATFGAPMEADAIVNTIAMNLNVEPAVKQQLLEMESTELRYRAVHRVLSDASATQDALDESRHRFPSDRREN